MHYVNHIVRLNSRDYVNQVSKQILKNTQNLQDIPYKCTFHRDHKRT